MDSRQIALDLLVQGFSVIPLKPEEKTPLIPWKEFQSRLATPQEVASWYDKEPNAGVAIVTGSISNVVAVDCDVPEIVARQRLDAAGLPLPATLVNATPRGGHHLYRAPGRFESDRGLYCVRPRPQRRQLH